MNQKLKLGLYPTPVHKLEYFSNQFDREIWIKRDDLTGFGGGGNKVRKLEFLLKDALNKSCDTVITMGSQQSNHCRQTAAACAKLGLQCHLVLKGEKPQTNQGNLLLMKLFGAHTHFTGNQSREDFSENLSEKLASKNHSIYMIPIGGSNLIGSLGYVHAIEELKEQKTDFDYIIVASGSGGTQAGIELGLRVHQLNSTLISIKIDKDLSHGKSIEENAGEIIEKGIDYFSLKNEIQTSDFITLQKYADPGYAVITDHEQLALKEMAIHEGIILDPVYTGRAFYALLDLLNNDFFPKNSKLLFWHTGGAPANFYYNSQILNSG